MVYERWADVTQQRYEQERQRFVNKSTNPNRFDIPTSYEEYARNAAYYQNAMGFIGLNIPEGWRVYADPNNPAVHSVAPAGSLEQAQAEERAIPQTETEKRTALKQEVATKQQVQRYRQSEAQSARYDYEARKQREMDAKEDALSKGATIKEANQTAYSSAFYKIDSNGNQVPITEKEYFRLQKEEQKFNERMKQIKEGKLKNESVAYPVFSKEKPSTFGLLTGREKYSPFVEEKAIFKTQKKEVLGVIGSAPELSEGRKVKVPFTDFTLIEFTPEQESFLKKNVIDTPIFKIGSKTYEGVGTLGEVTFEPLAYVPKETYVSAGPIGLALVEPVGTKSLKERKEFFKGLGRTTAQIAPLFLSSPVGTTARATAILASEEPIDFIGNVTGGIIFEGGLKATSKTLNIAKTLVNPKNKILNVASLITEKGVPLYFTSEIALSLPEAIKNPVVSKKLGSGLASFGLGAKVGKFGFNKIGEVKFIGAKEIPVENIIEPQILSGKERFPSANISPEKLKQEFKYSQYALEKVSDKSKSMKELLEFKTVPKYLRGSFGLSEKGELILKEKGLTKLDLEKNELSPFLQEIKEKYKVPSRTPSEYIKSQKYGDVAFESLKTNKDLILFGKQAENIFMPKIAETLDFDLMTKKTTAKGDILGTKTQATIKGYNSKTKTFSTAGHTTSQLIDVPSRKAFIEITPSKYNIKLKSVEIEGINIIPIEESVKAKAWVLGREQQKNRWVKDVKSLERLTEGKIKATDILERQKSAGVWHSTAEPFKTETKTEIGERPDEPGFYVSPSLSPAFLRLDKGETSSVSDLFGSTGTEPSALWIRTEVTRFPKKAGTTLSELNKYLIEKAEKGKAFISPRFELRQKSEKEAVIAPETTLKRIKYADLISNVRGFKEYFTYRGTGLKGEILKNIPFTGTKVPIRIYETEKEIKTTDNKLNNLLKNEFEVLSRIKNKEYLFSTEKTGGIKLSSLKSNINLSLIKPTYSKLNKSLEVSKLRYSKAKPSQVSSSLASSSKVSSSKISSLKSSSNLSSSSVMKSKPSSSISSSKISSLKSSSNLSSSSVMKSKPSSSISSSKISSLKSSSTYNEREDTSITDYIKDRKYYPLERKEEAQKKGFNVFLKARPKRGEKQSGKQNWIKLNTKPLTELSALSLGSRIADTYVERSFKLSQTNKPADTSITETGWDLRKNKFRTSKRGNAYVEKTTHAIDSFEEKQGIPYKSMQMRKAGTLKIKTPKIKKIKIKKKGFKWKQK